MTKQEFKQKFFTDNFYWADETNSEQLQKIGIEVGCLCHTGNPEIINWHEGFKNLGFRTYEKNDNVTMFQKEPFLLNSQKATDFEDMINAYSELS